MLIFRKMDERSVRLRRRGCMCRAYDRSRRHRHCRTHRSAITLPVKWPDGLAIRECRMMPQARKVVVPVVVAVTLLATTALADPIAALPASNPLVEIVKALA